MGRDFDPYSPSSLLGDIAPQGGPAKRKRTFGSDTRRAATSAYDKASNPPKDRGIYDDLATQFRTEANAYVAQGHPLVAMLLQRRVEADERLMKTTIKKVERPSSLVQEMVAYMIKWFWKRVPNEQRDNALNTLLSPNWWDALVEETLDHQAALRIGDDEWKPAGGWSIGEDPFYEPWMTPDPNARPALEGTLAERLAQARRNRESK